MVSASSIVIVIVVIAISATILGAIILAVYQFRDLFRRHEPASLQELPNPSTTLPKTNFKLIVYSQLNGAQQKVFDQQYTIPSNTYTAKSLASKLNSLTGTYIRSQALNLKLQQALSTSTQAARYEDVIQIYFPVDVRYYTVIAKRLSQNSASTYTITFLAPAIVYKALGAVASKEAKTSSLNRTANIPNAIDLNIDMSSRIVRSRIDAL